MPARTNLEVLIEPFPGCPPGDSWNCCRKVVSRQDPSTLEAREIQLFLISGDGPPG